MNASVDGSPLQEERTGPDETLDVALIGAGKMGLPIAGHFYRGGHRVVVFDTAAERVSLAREIGLRVASTLEEAMASATVILSSLPQDEAFESVAGAVAARIRRGQVYVDTSTVSMSASRRVASKFDEVGGDYLRVAVSGNPQMVEQAQLTAIGSGRRGAWDRVLPLLRLLGKGQFYVGAGEEARVMKLVINLMVASTAAMLGEALALGQKGGLDWSDMWEVITASAVGSPVIKAKAAQLRNYDFAPTFTVVQMLKDVGLILDAGSSLGVPLRQTANMAQLLQWAIDGGLGGEDYAAVVKVVQRSAGLPTHV